MSGILNSHARHSGKDFDRLPSSARETLSAYGISGDDWKVVQAAVTDIEGYKLIDPEKIADVKVREKYENLLFDQSSIATAEPSVRVRAMTNQGKPRGYLVNELWKLAFQLKPFAMTTLRDQWEIGAKGVGKLRRGDYKGAANEFSYIMQLAIGGTAMAAVGNALSDISKGQEPTFDLARSVSASAFGGLVSDLTVNYALNTYGQQYLARIMAPTFGRANEVVSYAVGASYREPSWRSYIPGQNLYFAPALEYLFINEAIDTFAPGYLNDVEKKMNKRGEPLVGPSLYRDMQ
jgi:hypothetical protein